jgi:hypothetical protein
MGERAMKAPLVSACAGAVSLLFGLLPAVVFGTTVQATKNCSIGSTAQITEGVFTLGSPQRVRWTADYSFNSPCNGDAFFVTRGACRDADVALTTSRQTGGLQELGSPGIWRVSICNSQMGAGTYTVVYNQDLFIRPWSGAPEWKSPDISAVGGNLVRGRLNQVRITIHKSAGPDQARDLRVSVKWAPWNVGLPDLAFKAEPSVSVISFDGPALDVVLNVDLRNPNETNGGAWPRPISEFEHFCIVARVDFESDLGPGAKQDINLANNEARSNFAAVGTNIAQLKRCFLVANPDSLQASIPDSLSLELMRPNGTTIRLIGWPGAFGKKFLLKPGEVRTACIGIDARRGLSGRGRAHLVSIGLRKGTTLHSGVALQLTKRTGRKD